MKWNTNVDITGNHNLKADTFTELTEHSQLPALVSMSLLNLRGVTCACEETGLPRVNTGFDWISALG